MIDVEKEITISGIEQLYEQLYSMPDETRKSDIRIPLKLESTEFGIIPALIQFVSTWIRSGKNGSIRVPFSNIEQQAERFVNEDFSFPLIIMNWKYGIVNDSDGQDIRAMLRDYTAAVNLRMRSLKGLRGNQLLLTCFDQFPAKTGLLHCFYSDSLFVEKEDALEFTLMPTLVHILSLSKDAFRRSLKSIGDDIRGIIYELMKNTDEWARTDKNDKPLNPNIRGVYVKITRRRKQNLIDHYRNNDIFSDYFSDQEPTSNGEVYFMELSVFDSGPGFIDRNAKGHEIHSTDESVNILRGCLTLHNTSAIGIRSFTKGQGLDRMLNILNEKGMLMIRTNHLAVYRNLKRHKYERETNPTAISLFDWQSHSATRFTKMPNATGAVLSIIYPLS